MTTPARHGTPSGYNAHRRIGEEACAPCWDAMHEANMRRKSAPDFVVQNRQRARAQSRARARLTRMYPTVYRALYLEELQAVEEETR